MSSIDTPIEPYEVAGPPVQLLSPADLLAVARIRDPQALIQRGSGLFAHDGSSGIDFVTSEHETVGTVVSRRLEASNVDLSREFGELILLQRGFQASSQVVSVSNEMIQQLFGMRGQG